MTTHDTLHDETLEAPFDGIEENRENPPPVYFNILYYGLIIWAVLFIGYFLFSGWSSHAEFQAKMKAHQERVTAGVQQGRQQ
ncbi:cbb3-type cytochrome c oxidase N-terminal domain-containing protein [Thermodesulfobacteriota bacterium B35]